MHFVPRFPRHHMRRRPTTSRRSGSTPKSRLTRRAPESTSSTEDLGLVRQITLLWKRLTRPTSPRHSRRFSFVPPGFDIMLIPTATSTAKKPRSSMSSSRRRSRRVRRQGMYFDNPPHFFHSLDSFDDVADVAEA